jgi:hypothetical protein
LHVVIPGVTHRHAAINIRQSVLRERGSTSWSRLGMVTASAALFLGPRSPPGRACSFPAMTGRRTMLATRLGYLLLGSNSLLRACRPWPDVDAPDGSMDGARGATCGRGSWPGQVVLDFEVQAAIWWWL